MISYLENQQEGGTGAVTYPTNGDARQELKSQAQVLKGSCTHSPPATAPSLVSICVCKVFMVYLRSSTARARLVGVFELKKKYVAVFFLTSSTNFQRAKNIHSVPSGRACMVQVLTPVFHLFDLRGKESLILWAFHIQCRLPSFVFDDGGF